MVIVSVNSDTPTVAGLSASPGLTPIEELTMLLTYGGQG
jgi:hypothetical protein